MAYDMAVVKTAYATATSMGVSNKILMALFEAGIVESGFRNLDHGDRDSVGYLQQRPSQGWPNPMDVPTATRSFVNRAKPIENVYSTAGQLAQAVQRSAFPLKYDAVAPQAASLLAQVSGSAAANPFGVVPDVGSLNNVNKALDALTDGATWVRASMFIGGAGFLLYGIIKLTGANPVQVAKLAAFKGKT